MILWNLFNAAVSHASESMLQNAGIIRKIYFPRLIIPGSSVLVALFDFMMAFFIFLVFCFVYKQPLHWYSIFYFAAGTGIIIVAGFGAGTFLAALNVKYRDFRYTIPFLLQLLFFSSQVIYPLYSVQQTWLKFILAINPVNAAIELFRSAISNVTPDTTITGIGVASTALIFCIGLYYFRKTEAYFADLA